MPGGELFSVMRTLLALAGVCALAWVVLAWLARRGFGVVRPSASARLQVLERVVLAPRKELYLVRADARVFLVGVGEASAPNLIAELDSQAAASNAALQHSGA